MSRKNENEKGANGVGSIRKITTTHNGKEYTYWQGRYTEGYDACTGKQIQRSITGKTQKQVAQKLRQITAEIDAKAYVAPCKLSVAEWMAVWAQDYLVGIKVSTAYLYKRTIELYIEPHLDHIRLDALNAHQYSTSTTSLPSRQSLMLLLSPQSPSRTFTVCCTKRSNKPSFSTTFVTIRRPRVFCPKSSKKRFVR